MRRFSIFRVAFGAVEVQGASMEPTFRSGDWLLVRWFSKTQISSSRTHLDKAKANIGEIVLIERELQPGIVYTKRVTKLDGKSVNPDVNSYWVEGDNPAGTDSRSWGWVKESEIVGKVLLRYKKSKAI